MATAAVEKLREKKNDILREFRGAKNKKAQLIIIAQSYGVQKADVIRFLILEGIDVTGLGFKSSRAADPVANILLNMMDTAEEGVRRATEEYQTIANAIMMYGMDKTQKRKKELREKEETIRALAQVLGSNDIEPWAKKKVEEAMNAAGGE